ncbi:tRNA ligase, partial [Violaceomyces palustris]
SWKTSEFAYRKSNSTDSQLPTLARGLFTQPIYSPSSPTASEHQPACHRIAVRGYDKFFNVGEMPWTKPESIRLYTTPPYEVTFKENGCIIFASALSPQRIVVTSKHSLGPSPQNTGPSHAEKGEEWLERHLGAKGRTKSELANELWRRNETAVFELCDDSFEEHVIEYPKEKTGLHLHGL